MSLVRGVDSDPRRQSIVRSMKLLCDELDMLVVAEGVETECPFRPRAEQSRPGAAATFAIATRRTRMM
jgi:predicted signal transduction protein with EAL and GGDEF domain